MDATCAYWTVDATRGEHRIIARAETQTAAWNELLRVAAHVVRQS